MPPPSMTKKISPNVSIHEKCNYVSRLDNHSPLSIFPLTDRLLKGHFLYPVPLLWSDLQNGSGSVEKVRALGRMTFNDIQ